MDIEKYKPLIAKILVDSTGKKLSADEVASRICQRIADIELLMPSLGNATLLNRPPLTQQFPDLPKAEAQPEEIMSVRDSRAQDMDISRRIDSASKPDEGLIERWTVDQLSDFAKNEMPSLLQVQPEGFDRPFSIAKFIEAAPGGLPFLRIVYQQPEAPIMTEGNAQRVGPTIQISTTDAKLDADELTENVITQAKAMYSKTPRVLVPKAPATQFSPGDLRGALSAEAPGTGEEGLMMPGGITQDGRLVTGDLSRQWQQQRRRQ